MHSNEGPNPLICDTVSFAKNFESFEGLYSVCLQEYAALGNATGNVGFNSRAVDLRLGLLDSQVESIVSFRNVRKYSLKGKASYPQTLESSTLIKIHLDATVCRYLFTAKSLYMFRVSQHPSSGVLKTVTATSGTGHNIGISPTWPGRDLATLEGSSCTDNMTCTGGCGYRFSTPDNRCGGHLKHVE